MKIKDGFVKKEVAGTCLVIAVGKRASEFNAMVKLNETGAFLFDLMKEGNTKEQMLERMLAEYEVEKQVAEQDINEFVNKMIEAKIAE